jgi:hypothetical protein
LGGPVLWSSPNQFEGDHSGSVSEVEDPAASLRSGSKQASRKIETKIFYLHAERD